MKTRILAFFLTLCMILSMVPAVAFAEEAPAPSMNAINFNSSFEKDATIKLDQDLTVALTTAVTGKVTIDLNGFELDGTIVGTEGLTIEVKDSSKTHGTINVAVTNATVLMTQGKIGAATLASKYEINTESDVAANDVTYYGKVWAIGEVGYANLTKALTADVAANTTITYCGTAALTENIVPNKDVIVDVKGAAITFGTLGAEGKNLTIKNAKYADGVVFAGNVTLDGCSTTGITAFSTTGAGKLTVANGTHAWLTQELVNNVANKVSVPANAVVINNTVVVPEAGNTGSIVAVIGAKGYDSLSKAIAAWMGMTGCTSIDLIADIEGYVELTGAAAVTLNLNNHHINATFINNGELIVTGTGSISAITNKGKLTLDGEASRINSLTNLGTFEMKAGWLDSFGTGSDLEGVTVYGGYVDNDIYNQDYVDAGSVGYKQDGVVNNSATHTFIKAAPAVIKNGAASVKGYTSFAFAWADVLAGKFDFDPTITLNDNATYIGADIGEADNKLHVETTLTIDVNGYTLTLGEDAKRGNILVDETTAEGDKAIGNLTLTTSKAGGKVVSTGTTVITYNNAVVTLDGGVELSCTGEWAPLYMYGGTAYVYNAVITNTSVWEAIGVEGGNLIIGKEGGKDTDVIITATKFTAISVDSNATGAKAEVTVNCGTITGGTGYYALYLDGPSAGTINGGNFKADSHTVWVGYDNDDDKTELNISGGTFASITGKNIHVPTEAGTVTISGGTFNNVDSKEDYTEISEYFAEGYVTNADWTFEKGMTVTDKAEYVIAVNGVKYSSWAAAKEASINGNYYQIQLFADMSVEIPEGVLVGKVIQLNLNGYKLLGLTLEGANTVYIRGAYGKKGGEIAGTIVAKKANASVFVQVEGLWGEVTSTDPLFNLAEGSSATLLHTSGTPAVISSPIAHEDNKGAIAIQGCSYSYDIGYTYVPADYIVEYTAATKDAAEYWTVSLSDQIVAEIVTLGGAVIEKFTTVGAAVDYYLEKCVTNANPPYIKLYKNDLNVNPKAYDFEATDADKYYGVKIFVAVNDATLKFHNDSDYVVVESYGLNLTGIANLKAYTFADTVAQVEDGDYYATVEAAIAAAVKAGKAVIILDKDLTFTVDVDADVTIDLNGKSVASITINKGNATVKSGTIEKLVVNGGKFINLGTAPAHVTIVEIEHNGGAINLRNATLVGYAGTETVDSWVVNNSLWTEKGDDVKIVRANTVAAMIGKVAYPSLQDALNAAENDDVIVFYFNKNNDNTIPYGLTVKIVDSSATEDPSILTTVRVDANIVRWDTIVTVGDDGTTYSAKNRVAIVDGVKYYEDTFTSEVLKGAATVAIHDITNITEDIVIDGATVEMIFATNTKEDNAKTITVNSGTITSMPTATYAPDVKVLIGSVENVRIVVNPTTAEWDFVKGVAEKATVYFVENHGAWVIKNAPVTAEGVGYPTIQDAVVAGAKNIKLLADVTTNVTIALIDNITLDLDGHTLTLANEGGLSLAAPAITVNNNVTIKNGKIALDDSKGNDNYVLIAVIDGGDLTVEGLTIPKAFGYNMTEGYTASVVVNGKFFAKNSVIEGSIVALGKNVTTLNRENVKDAYWNVIGEFTCGSHTAPENGKCPACGEKAYKVTLGEGVNITIGEGVLYTVEGNTYYFYKDTVVEFSTEVKPAFGYYFVGFNVDTNYTVVADVEVEIVWSANNPEDITINASDFNLNADNGNINENYSGLNDFTMPAGAVITVSYTGNKQVVWVNGDGKIVSTSNTFDYVVPEHADTLTAVVVATGNAGADFIILNGENKIGSTVLAYGSYGAFTKTPVLPEVIGLKTVAGWAINGNTEVVYTTANALMDAIKALDATGENEKVVVTPVFAQSEVTVNVYVNAKGEKADATFTALTNEITRYELGVDGMYVVKWTVFDKNNEEVYSSTNATLAYVFADGMYVVVTVTNAASPEKDYEVEVNGIYDSTTKKFTVFAHYVINGEKYTMTSVAIKYSTNGTDYMTKYVNNVAGLNDVTYTLNLNNATAHAEALYVIAVVTCVDENGHSLTFATKVLTIESEYAK